MLYWLIQLIIAIYAIHFIAKRYSKKEERRKVILTITKRAAAALVLCLIVYLAASIPASMYRSKVKRIITLNVIQGHGFHIISFKKYYMDIYVLLRGEHCINKIKYEGLSKPSSLSEEEFRASYKLINDASDGADVEWLVSHPGVSNKETLEILQHELEEQEKNKPKNTDLAGQYFPTAETLQWVRNKGKYPETNTSFTIFTDGSFQMINMPNWWNTSSDKPKDGFESGSGRWQVLRYQGGWDIELRFASRTNLNSTNKEQCLQEWILITSQTAPYRLCFAVGSELSARGAIEVGATNLDEVEAMFFEKK